MKYTLEEARALVKQFVDSGSCRDAVIDARINEAMERLVDLGSGDWECLRRFMRFTVLSQSFVLPPNVEKVIWATADGTPAKMLGRPYQFLSSGVGDLAYRTAGSGSGFKDIMDLGDNWAVMYEIPASAGALPLVLVADEAGDAGELVDLQGRNADHRSLSSQVAVQALPEGITLETKGTWDDSFEALSLSEQALAHVDIVVKPATTGQIHLLAVDEDSGVYYKLATYEPGVLRPKFRRYRLTNFYPVADDACTDVLALVRLRFTKLVNADDEILLDSIQALKLMVIAIREENAGNLQGATNYTAQAIAVLSNREKSNTLHDGTPTILNMDYRASLGRHLNKGYLVI